MFQKNCDICKEIFWAGRSIDIYCSIECRTGGTAEKARQRTKEWRKNNLERARKNDALYRKANVAKVKKTIKAWHLANPEKRSEHCAKWRKNHAIEIKKSKAEWFLANCEKSVIYSQRRRAKKLENGGNFTDKEWQDLKQFYDYRCLCCEKTEPEIKITVDHIIPVTLGGANSIENIQPLCLICNLSKGTKIIDYRPK